jgi:hypothetical protein
MLNTGSPRARISLLLPKSNEHTHMNVPHTIIHNNKEGSDEQSVLYSCNESLPIKVPGAGGATTWVSGESFSGAPYPQQG